MLSRKYTVVPQSLSDITKNRSGEALPSTVKTNGLQFFFIPFYLYQTSAFRGFSDAVTVLCITGYKYDALAEIAPTKLFEYSTKRRLAS